MQIVKPIDKLIHWLESELTHFVSLVEEGSVAAGDPWQEGFSDHDLQIIVSQDETQETQAIREYLNLNMLGNEYLVTVRLLENYLKGQDSLNDISLKFRATTLSGQNVIEDKALPDMGIALKIGQDGLDNLVGRLERRWLNLTHWDNKYAQHKNYGIYKNFYVYYSALHYGKTGYYPASRAEASSLLPNADLADNLLSVTNDIGNSTKDAQGLAITSAIQLITEIRN